ncbi:MAG TPA: isoprenylcysteine carboxylmethyltransferase family protein [Chitinivibrionales bacterium]|nr:isoprenylcysteine carboxylmethyltransferase family protein [Chitinivibrionales bacterium]
MIFDLDKMHSPPVLTWIVMIAAYGFLEVAIGLRARAGSRRKRVRDATFYLVTVPAMAAMYGAFFEAMLKSHSLPALWFGSGTVILAGGIALRITALLQLGRGFSTKVERSEGQALYTRGIYGVIRHPLYAATLLQVIGSGVMLHSALAFILFPFSVAGILLRIRKEERFMAREFPGYGHYMEKTKRLVPWIC